MSHGLDRGNSTRPRKFTITFTSNIENPEINAIELVPQS